MVATYNAKAEIKHTSVYLAQVCYAQCLATYLRKQGKLANGFYTCIAKTKDGKTYFGKLIKQ
jgi:hypothetical protein